MPPVVYGYDDDGLLVSAGDMTILRDPITGLIRGSTLGLVTDEYDYNLFGELKRYTARFDGSVIFDVEYERDGEWTRDRLGRITKTAETIQGETTTYEYQYDLAGRLEKVWENEVLVSTYTYGPNGNRLSHTTPSGTVIGTYDDQDRLTRYGDAAYEYTAHGDRREMTDSNGTTRYEYDQEGRLRGAVLHAGEANETEIEYIVDDDGRRLASRTGAEPYASLLYQSWLRPAARLGSSGAVEAVFVYDDAVNVPAYIQQGGSRYRIIRDHLGSARVVVDTTSGFIAQGINYDAFGVISEDTSPAFQPFGFAGGLNDYRSESVRFGARDYDASVGRWTDKDPIGFVGGDPSLYGYGGGDPVNAADPGGRQVALAAPGLLLGAPGLGPVGVTIIVLAPSAVIVAGKVIEHLAKYRTTLEHDARNKEQIKPKDNIQDTIDDLDDKDREIATSCPEGQTGQTRDKNRKRIENSLKDEKNAFNNRR